jgi:anti-anti-sigma factor
MLGELDVLVTAAGEPTRVPGGGEIEPPTSTRLNRELDAVLDRQPQRLRIDLTAVPFMDTTGVAVLLKARRRAIEQDCRFSVSSASPALTRLFEITGLAGLLADD